MKKVAIIGGGVAGLSAGIYGQMNGYSCTVIEKNPIAGGNLTGWERDGYRIDNCMHWLTGTRSGGKYNRMWHELGVLGKGVELNVRDPFYFSELGNVRIGMWRDTARTLREMKLASPVDTKESERFIGTVNGIINGVNSGDRLLKSRAYAIAYLRYGRMTLGELAKRFDSELVRCLMTDYFGSELAAVTLVYAYATFALGDGDLPADGSRAAARRMEKRFADLGGRLLTSTEASRIAYRDRAAYGVVTSDGHLVPADAVICCCDPRVTFGRLLPDRYMPPALAREYKKGGGELFSSLHVAFACRDAACIPKCVTVLDVRPMKLDGRIVDRMAVIPYREGFAPEGEAVVQVLIFVHEATARQWIAAFSDKARYAAAKDKLARAVKRRIAERYPRAADGLKLLDVWTPATYAQLLSSFEGSYMSFAATPRGLTYRAPTVIRGLDNVYLATQWQSSPGGLPVAARAGMRAIGKLDI